MSTNSLHLVDVGKGVVVETMPPQEAPFTPLQVATSSPPAATSLEVATSTPPSSTLLQVAAFSPPAATVIDVPDEPPPVPPPRRRTLWTRIKIKLRRIYRKLGLKHVASLMIVVMYTIIGGLMFLATEYYYDLDEKKTANETFQGYRDPLPKNIYRYIIKNCSTTVRDDHIDYFAVNNETECIQEIDSILGQYHQDINVTYPIDTKWDFWYSVYFACTIYTTIGYGDIYCKSFLGRSLTMLYALFGIPLLLTTLNDLGKAMFNLIHRLITYEEWVVARVRPLINRFMPSKQPKTPLQEETQTNLQYSTVQELQYHESLEYGSSSDEETGKVEKPKRDKDGNEIIMLSEKDDDEEAQEEEEAPEKEIPVTLALVVTVGWIFGCAAIFCIWEEKWSYFGSIYFFFISLTTIGLGDVTPEHPKYMIISYGLVIIGLALVSMCINVIQRKLEQLYYQLLQMILDEYTKQLSTGSNQLNATMGMMRMWNQNAKAKLLVPLLSKDKKQSVAQKFQEEKKAQGITLPPVLKQMDRSTGMPVMFSVAKQEDVEEPEFFEAAVLDSLQKADAIAVARKDSIPMVAEMLEMDNVVKVPAVLYDATTETEKLEVEDKHEQTIIVECFDGQVQTDASVTNVQVDEASQTHLIEHDVAEVQTFQVEFRTEESQTTIIAKEEAFVQTSKLQSHDQELQTHVYDITEQEVQTEPPQTKNERIQTPIPEFQDIGIQTDPVKHRRSSLKKGSPHPPASTFAATARKKLRKALGGKSKKKELEVHPQMKVTPSQPAMATWADIEGGDIESELGDGGDTAEMEEEEEEAGGSHESEDSEEKDLEWDPVDGMHAEKQKKVRDLKKMFETKPPFN